ncbi:MAG: homoserine dehydrogenase [Candidatus Methanoplasma sp.]|jgi:ACT domain-containing protein|nr:homoserine dehydrogenase [Candidatus Methanoplasma sp.]
MMVNAQLYVKDLPGHLVESLEPISLVNGNIVGVVHDREQIVNQRISIDVTFEIKGTSELEQLKAIWKSKDVLIAKMGSVYKTYTMEYMLVGKFTASFVESLIDEASVIVSFESIDVNYSSRNASSTRTAMISAEVMSENDLKKLDLFLMDACKKSGIVYIRGL